ncbi:Uncharacterised protein [Rodentibacter pneumotropicus]|uniref:Uncharacterized protein n=1 Tax=Rodentibacter pneumotropicus TaxID=758 RepID=A0A3S4U0S8_9PAST|nr:Uncharacterised protein [Rodentibacter pneumotropicus]
MKVKAKPGIKVPMEINPMSILNRRLLRLSQQYITNVVFRMVI